ncbi:MAG: KEOPS complex kinase/ATPase Bud32 [Candidatus Nanoarchaeia archaeon]|nr:KEOPS complex kinase/ATPase Bud32 [Candidatus Nanoarchaeia archaeon]
MKKIASGAEAVLYTSSGKLFKKRLKKGYRIPEIDVPLRKIRTRTEASLLERAQKSGVHVPKVLKKDEKEMIIEMQFIEGVAVKDILSKENMQEICSKIGRQIALLHKNNIVHGDLTTSNMILSNEQIYFVDFGLGKFSNRIEDYAGDMHLIERALESRHTSISEECFKIIVKEYLKNFEKGKRVLERHEIVRKRGRYFKERV